MASVKNVEKHIWDIEGFDVAIKHLGGRNVRSDRTGLPMYPYDRAAKNDMKVEQWVKARFNLNYPGFNVEVLNAYGAAVTRTPSWVVCAIHTWRSSETTL